LATQISARLAELRLDERQKEAVVTWLRTKKGILYVQQKAIPETGQRAFVFKPDEFFPIV
jgi:hypothetical protein